MAGIRDSIAVKNSLVGTLYTDNPMNGMVGTAYNPTYALVNEAGAQIVLFINNADYKMYAQLKDKNGNLLYTSNIIDLPLESVVMNGRYDSTTKEVVLTLVNGNEIRFSVEDLVRGLVDEDQLEEALSGYWSKEDLTEEDIENWNNKQDYLNQGENIQIYSDLNLKGNIEQNSTTGKNLAQRIGGYLTSNGTFKTSNDDSFYFPVTQGETYTYNAIGNRTLGAIYDNIPTNNATPISGTYSNNMVKNTPFTASATGIMVIYANTPSSQDTINSFIAVKGNEIGDYEPYTNGASPNPDCPQPIHIVSGDNEIKVCNKNLINSTAYNKAANTTNGAIIIPATTANYLSIDDYVNVEPNTTYTISFEKEDGGRLLIATKDQNGEFIERIDLGVTRTFTTGSNVYQAFLYLYKSGGSYTEGGWVQLEKGSTATDYVPHQEYTKEINLPVENLANLEQNIQLPISANITILDLGKDVTFENITTSFYLNNAIYTNASGGLIDYQKNDGTHQYILSGNFKNNNNEGMLNNKSLTGHYYKTETNITFRKVVVTTYTNFTQGAMSVQIEYGSKANSYTPYGTTPIEVGSIGEYEDEFFKNTTDSEYYDSTLELDKWYLKKRIGKVVLDGSEDWNKLQALTNTITFQTIDVPTNAKLNIASELKYLSDKFIGNNNYSLDSEHFYVNNNGKIVLFINSSRLSSTDVAGFKTWLSNNNPIVYYVLSTPENILLNDTLQETLDSFYSMQEQTNISQSNNDLPFVIKARAIKEIAETAD